MSWLGFLTEYPVGKLAGPPILLRCRKKLGKLLDAEILEGRERSRHCLQVTRHTLISLGTNPRCPERWQEQDQKLLKVRDKHSGSPGGSDQLERGSGTRAWDRGLQTALGHRHGHG